MNKKLGIGIIIVVAIVAMVIFAGCVEKEAPMLCLCLHQLPEDIMVLLGLKHYRIYAT